MTAPCAQSAGRGQRGKHTKGQTTEEMGHPRSLWRNPFRSCCSEVKGWVPTIPTEGATGADDETQNQMFRDMTNQKNDIMNALKACAAQNIVKPHSAAGNVKVDSSPQQILEG